MEEKGEPVDDSYLDYFTKIIEDHNTKFDDPQSRENNMEYDLLTTDWILEKVRNSETYAQNLYASMCNNDFIPIKVVPILRQDPKKDYWGASWRYAGGIIADMRQQGDYIDWYCSGIRGGQIDDDESNKVWDDKKYVPEGMVTDEIRADLQRLGWAVAPGGDWEKFNRS